MLIVWRKRVYTRDCFDIEVSQPAKKRKKDK